ncbi:hypothetical protein N9A10_01195 [Candidatus Pelagibacter sp.]|nr:hypothetical protein [Candidatus Pelagibacter sp.]
MGWQAAVVGAMGVAQYKSQGAIGDFNEAVNDRNAKVLEQQGTAIERKTEFDLKQFDKEFVKLRGQTKVAVAKSGATYEGSALRVARSNEKEKILQENLIKYNSKMAVANKIEQASFARIKGDMAQQSAKFAQIQTVASTGTSLLTMYKGTTV